MRSLIAIAALVVTPFAFAENIELVCKDEDGRLYDRSFMTEDFTGTAGKCSLKVLVTDSRIEQWISCPSGRVSNAGKTIKRVERTSVSRMTGLLQYTEYDDWGYTTTDPDVYYQLSCEKATKKF